MPFNVPIAPELSGLPVFWHHCFGTPSEIPLS